MSDEEIKPTLQQLLNFIDKVDDGEIDLDELYLEVSREALPEKLDDYINLSKILEQRAEFCAKRQKEFGEKAKALENQRRAVLDRLAWLMDKYQFNTLHGHQYSITVYRTLSVGTPKDIDPKEYVTTYPEFIRAKTTYDFDKTKIKEYLTENRNEVLPFGVLQMKPSIRTKIRT